MKGNTKNLIQIHFAVLLFGIAGIFGKLIDLPPTVIVLGRVLFAAVFLIFILLFLKQSIRLDHKKDYFFLVILGVILAFHWVAFFQSIQVSTVAVGLLSFATFPVFTAILEPIFTMDKFKVSDISVAMLTFLGIALVIPEFKLGNNTTQGVIWGVASGFSFAILSILNKKYVKQYSAIVIAFYQDSIATIVLIPFLLIIRPDFQTNDILLLILLGVVFTAVAHTLFIKGLTNVRARTASIIASLEPVYGIFFAILILGELPGMRVIFGGVVILSAAFYATTTHNN